MDVNLNLNSRAAVPSLTAVPGTNQYGEYWIGTVNIARSCSAHLMPADWRVKNLEPKADLRWEPPQPYVGVATPD
jgi:hypothetical protein